MSNSFSIKEMNQWALVSFALLGFIIGYFAHTVINPTLGASPTARPSVVQNNPTPTPTPTPTPNVPAPAGAPIANAADADDDPYLGEEDAPVTLIEFTDYQCPYCGRHASQTVAQLKSEYADTGKIKYVVRDYPLAFHPFAQKAAEASECADDQGEFWGMHDKMFANQTALDVDSLKKYAADLGLDQTEFADCLDSGTHAEEAKKDMADGSASGITGTPGFILIAKDGTATKISGAMPFASFKAAIDAAL
ncbi:MAG TPA: DsbA family protein [Candidatus Peribacterales bacterium]|nr:DsbA family protein [Candidatus Peribacterales bacterium]